MEITKDIQIIDLALYINKSNTLIIADTHIGYEEALNKQGILIPRFQFKEIIERLENILKKATNNKKTKLNQIIINGDIKHEFGTISEQEWRHTLRLLDFLAKHCKEIILIKGNHDTILGPIAEKRKVKVKDEHRIDNTLIIHGDKIPKKLEKTIIIAHEHPAITLRDNLKTEKVKCFLKGKYKKNTLIVQPSFNFVTEGTDVLKEKLLSPFLKQNLKDFNCYVIADKIYNFGKLNNL